MEAAIFDCPPAWEPWLPAGVRRICVEDMEKLYAREWDLLALASGQTMLCESGPAGEAGFWPRVVRCRTLLAPGEAAPELLAHIQAEAVVTYGLSPRDSLTLSSLEAPVLCVQRTLPRPDGTVVEPGEFPLSELPLPAEELLPLLGLRLLQMPLTGDGFLW